MWICARSSCRIATVWFLSGALLFLAAADSKADKKKSAAAMLRAARAADSGRSEEAIAAYTEAFAADSSNVAALCGRGKVHLELGDRKKALADFDEALRIQPGDAPARVARADFY